MRLAKAPGDGSQRKMQLRANRVRTEPEVLRLLLARLLGELGLMLNLESLWGMIARTDALEGNCQGHCRHVGQLARSVALQMGLSNVTTRQVCLAGICHDVGKLGVPGQILTKRGPLTASEWHEIKAHPARGANLLAPYLGATPVPVFVRHHHEHFNGNGYPDRLTATAIPLGGRIVAAADAFESMTEGRPYREHLFKEKAIEELVACSSSQFDPVVTRALIEVVGG